ncbi:MAG: ArnT family glycosyltransferase [Armatimonadota bacterium]
MVDSAEVRPRVIDLLIVLLVASILRFGLLASAYLHGCDLVARSDEHGYHLLAVNLARHHVFTMAEPVGPTGRPEVGRTPAFPALMALIYLAVGERPYAVATVLALVSCWIPIAVYLVSLELFGRRTAIASGLTMAVTPAAVLYAGAILTDTLHTAILTMSLLSFVGKYSPRAHGASALAGLWLGLATLVRPVTAYLPIALSALLIALRRRLAWLLIPAAAYAVVFPWCLRNMYVSGRLQLSSIGRYNLIYYNLAFAKARAQGLSVDEVRRQYHDLANRLPGGSAEVAKREVPKYWRQLLLNQMIGAAAFWVVPDRFQWGYFLTGKYVETRAIERLWDSGLIAAVRRMLSAPGAVMAVVQVGANLVLTALAVMGLVSALRAGFGATVFAAVAICYALYYALLTGPVACGRYHMPVEPLIAIFAGIPVADAFDKLAQWVHSG